MLNGYVKISDLDPDTVYYITEKVFNKTFHADAKVFLGCPTLMRVQHSDYVILKGTELLKCRGTTLTDMVEKFLDSNIKRPRELKSEIVKVEKYKGWEISISDNSAFELYHFEWQITQGDRVFKDQTSTQNIETSVLRAKERIDYFENEYDASNPSLLIPVYNKTNR